MTDHTYLSLLDLQLVALVVGVRVLVVPLARVRWGY
tara:strand:- start:1611 stop:1718 length:108 start_codon:yes stop_codon:yes gene_type:complete